MGTYSGYHNAWDTSQICADIQDMCTCSTMELRMTLWHACGIGV